MKNLFKKAVTVFTMMGVCFATIAANSTCTFLVYQSKLPVEVDKMRKFK